MKWMFGAREVIKAFYERYDRTITAVVRFMFALATYLTVMYHTGYNFRITSPQPGIIKTKLEEQKSCGTILKR